MPLGEGRSHWEAGRVPAEEGKPSEGWHMLLQENMMRWVAALSPKREDMMY